MYNSFSGEILVSLGKCKSLLRVRLKHNGLTGGVPDNFWGLRRFFGPIPDEIGLRGNLVVFSGSDNSFTGRIPASMVKLRQLDRLDLSKNELTKGILEGISKNLFSGKVPIELQNLKLNLLNLSNNQLSAELPPLYASEIYSKSFLGNSGLCGDIVGLCPDTSRSKNRQYLWILRSIFILAGVVFVVDC
ncbi:hypothetical protein SLEP1_g53214 [Rubroshorea leprosula]|uniref:Uncharacterized protein n=1 Tax=Rubroshorea leprosula TaxID=152421 RepID=A0AAV5M9L9_9ROSI|nr:hypothetical protein SLEP1_g53214 [Rubroshorea leprosula]